MFLLFYFLSRITQLIKEIVLPEYKEIETADEDNKTRQTKAKEGISWTLTNAPRRAVPHPRGLSGWRRWKSSISSESRMSQAGNNDLSFDPYPSQSTRYRIAPSIIRGEVECCEGGTRGLEVIGFSRETWKGGCTLINMGRSKQ